MSTPTNFLVRSRDMTPEEQIIFKQALRDAVLFIAGLKLCSAIGYLGLYLLVNIYSEGVWSAIIRIMILTLIPLEIINALLLFLGALETKPVALKIAAIMCLFLGVFNTTLGVIGALFFFRVGTRAIHFMISFIFGLIALCFCSVLSYDLIIILMLVALLENPSQLQPNPRGTVAITHNRRN